MPAFKWTEEAIRQEALKYQTRQEFRRCAAGAYHAAAQRGLVDMVCEHIPPVYLPDGYWTLARCKTEASRFDCTTAWQREHTASYSTAYKRGWFDECTAHMVSKPQYTDNDTVYIWKAPGEYFKGKPVYKLGVTSKRLGEERVRAVNKNAEVIILQPVQGKATDHEAVLHILGDDPQYATGDGRTEFRALSDSELQEAIQYIEEVAA